MKRVSQVYRQYFNIMIKWPLQIIYKQLNRIYQYTIMDITITQEYVRGFTDTMHHYENVIKQIRAENRRVIIFLCLTVLILIILLYIEKISIEARFDSINKLIDNEWKQIYKQQMLYNKNIELIIEMLNRSKYGVELNYFIY